MAQIVEIVPSGRQELVFFLHFQYYDYSWPPNEARKGIRGHDIDLNRLFHPECSGLSTRRVNTSHIAVFWRTIDIFHMLFHCHHGKGTNCYNSPSRKGDNVEHTQPELTRTTRTPAFWGYPLLPNDYPYHWVILDPKSKEDKVKVTNLKNSLKFQIFEFWNGHYMRHTFWSWLIRCANMKWIRWVLLKIQSGHDSVHRRTDGQGDTSIPPFQLRWSGGYNKIWLAILLE